jgi:hypothetical protein
MLIMIMIMIIFLCIRTQNIYYEIYNFLFLSPNSINKYPLSLYMGRKNNKNKKQQYKKVNIVIPPSVITPEKVIEEPIIVNRHKIEIIDDYMNKLPVAIDKVIDAPAVNTSYGNSCIIF